MKCSGPAIEGIRMNKTYTVSAIVEINRKDRQILGVGVWYNL